MSRSLSGDTGSQPALSTTSARLVAVKLKSANKNIFRALMSLASASLLVRVMGLVNQIIVTARFGQGQEMDAYFVASTLPTLLAQLLASALEASVIPVYARVRTRGTKEQASRLFSTLLNLLIIGVVLLTVVMFVFRQQLLLVSAPGQPANVLNLTVSLVPLVFPVLGFMIFNSFMECLLNAEGKFGWPAYANLLVPLTTAFFVLLAGSTDGVFALGLGTLAGQILQLIVIIIRARRSNFQYRPVMNLTSPEMKQIFVAAGPALFGGLIGLASPLVDQIFASFIPRGGTISAINYAQKVNSVPTGVLFSAVGRAALPYLAAQAAIKDMRSFKSTLRLYVWAVAIATLFLTAVMTIGARPIIWIMFHRGNFTDQDATQTATVLAGLSIGMVPMAVGFIVSRAFSALGKTQVLMWVSITSVFLNAIFDAIFGRLWGAFGIAFATSVYYMFTMLILLITLRSTIGKLDILTPPKELMGMARQFIARVEESLNLGGMGMHVLRQKIIRAFFVLTVFAAGIAGTIANSIYTLRIAFGASLILVFLRYQYILLLAWASINVFIGTNLPFFNGGNLLSGLTLPSLLLLFYLPTKLALRRMVALRFMLIFIFWILPSVGFSPLTVSDFFISWTTLLDFVAVAVLTILVIDTRKRLLLFIDAMFVPAIFISFYGMWGFTHKVNGVLDTATGYFRISSIFGDTPPTLALYLSIMIPLTIYRIYTLRGFFKILLGFAVLLIFLTALALTFDRGSEISLPLGAVIILFFLPTKKSRAVMISAYAGLGVLALAVTSFLKIAIFSRFLNSDLTSLNGRTYLWQAIISHFDPAQLLGYGHKASDALLLNLKVGFGGGVIATVAHNIYLQTMYDHGLIGAGLLIMVLVALGLSLIMCWRKTMNHEHRFLITMAIWTFVAVVFQSGESNDIWNQSVGIYFFIFMALPFALYWSTPRQQTVETVEVEEIKTNKMAALPKLSQEEFAQI